MKGDVANYSFLSTYIFANVLKMYFPMDSIKGEHVVRLDKYSSTSSTSQPTKSPVDPVPRHKQITENV